jgi:hypothetical protein
MPRGKKRCPSCETHVASGASSCDCGHVFKKKKPAKPKIKKTDILKRLVEEPAKNKRIFYSREMKFLNDLVDKYSLEFMNVVNFHRQFESLTYLRSPKLKETLDKKFRAFNYVVDKSRYPEYNLGEKSGEDRFVEKKKKTIKNFLTDE